MIKEDRVVRTMSMAINIFNLTKSLYFAKFQNNYFAKELKKYKKSDNCKQEKVIIYKRLMANNKEQIKKYNKSIKELMEKVDIYD